MNFLHLRSERVTNHATEPPMAMPSRPAPKATMKELRSGSQKLTRLHSLPLNRFPKWMSVRVPVGRRVIFFSVPRWMVNMLLSMVTIGKRESTTSTHRKNTSSRLAGLHTKARSR